MPTKPPRSTPNVEKSGIQSPTTLDTHSDKVVDKEMNHSPINILHELLDKCTQPSSGPSSPELLKKVEELLISAAKTPQSNNEQQNTNELMEEHVEKSGLVSDQNKATKAKMKQSDIRKHLNGASERSKKDDTGSDSSEKKKNPKKARQKRRISTSPKDQNESKKGRQDDEESASMTEYESPYSAESESSENAGSYDPP